MTSPLTANLTTDENTTLTARAIAAQFHHGEMSELAREFNVSRGTAYARRELGMQVLTEEFEWRSECEERDAPLTTVQVTRRHLERSITALYMEGPYSCRDIEAVMPVLYPGLCKGGSFGDVQRLLVEAQGRAAEFNRLVDLSRIKEGALDEMFSQGMPVFTGVDLDSGYVFLAEQHGSRSGDQWAEALERKKAQGLYLEVVVKDAGTGLAAGVSVAFPGAEQRDDSFHALRKMSQEHYHLERRAYAALAEFYEAEAAQAKARYALRANLRALGQRVRFARQNAEVAMDRHDRFEALMKEAREAMEFVDANNGQLRTGQQCSEQLQRIADQMQQLGGKRIKKVARYLRNRAQGLGLYMDSLRTELLALGEQTGSMEAVRLSARAWRQAKEANKSSNRWERRRRIERLAENLDQLRRFGKKAFNLLSQVSEIIERRHRASSRIEQINSTLRPYLYVHKKTTQGFLELFMAWYNLRPKRTGRHKGKSPYEVLTGRKVDDWLEVLGYGID